MTIAALNTLVTATEQNTSQLKGLSAAYQVLLGGVPTIDGFTFLINNNNTTNFGAGAGVTFNDENVYINTMNALYQGNAQARANFDAIVAGQTSPAAKLTAIYNALIPPAAQSDAGRAYFIAQQDFYAARAAELGVAGDNGAALVGAAALAKIAVDNRIDGLGDDIRDLQDAIADGSAAIPQSGDNLTPVDQADGTNFDGNEGGGDDAGKTFTLTVNQDTPAGTAQNDTINGVATGAIGTSTLQVSDVINLGGGTDTANITETGGANLGPGTLPQMNGVEIFNLTGTGGGFDFDTTFAPDGTHFNTVSSQNDVDFVNVDLSKGQQFGMKGDNGGNDMDVDLASGDTGAMDAITLNLMGNKNGGEIEINGTAPNTSNGGVEMVNVNSTGSANTFEDIDSLDSVGANVLKDVKVMGDQDTTILDFNAGIDIVDGGSFDSSALTAKTNVILDDAGAITVKTGAMDDRVLLDGLSAADNVDLGDGKNDTVGIGLNGAVVAAGGMANVKNAENFEVLAAVNQDADNIGTFMNYIVSTTGNGGFFDLANNSNVQITDNTPGVITLENKVDGVADSINIELNNGANVAQTIGTLNVDANGAGTVEDVNINLGSPGGGVTITTNNITGRDINVMGADNFNLGALEVATISFNASKATGIITVAANAAQTVATGIQTGTGNDNVTLDGAAGGDVTADVGDGNDTVTIAGAQEHSVTLGAGTDKVEFDDLPAAFAAGAAINTMTEFLTIADFKTGEDTLELENTGQFVGLTAGTGMTAGEYVEFTLASTAATVAQIEAAASAAGVVAGQAYVAAVQIGGNTHLFYDTDGHAVAGGVSRFADLIGVDLNGVAATDFTVV